MDLYHSLKIVEKEAKFSESCLKVDFIWSIFATFLKIID